MEFKILHQDKNSKARVGEIRTAHGVINTPCFVPVGTQATVKSVDPSDLENIGVELFFVNTYHSYLRPGVEVIEKFGGLHEFMKWDHPLITDSGGFQVFSLARKSRIMPPKASLGSAGNHESGIKPHFAKSDLATRDEQEPELVKIDEEGVTFKSHLDGSEHRFTPEKSIQIQQSLGADLIIAFDECAPHSSTYDYAKMAMNRTHRWFLRSLEEFNINPKDQALYGVIQGVLFKDLREESAKFISSQDCDGIAIGGVAIGESKEEMREVLSWVTPYLPEEKPRHLLGVGEIDDIFAAVEYGMDTFDCVMPTRVARNGQLMINDQWLMVNGKRRWTIDINKAEFANDKEPIDKDCGCFTCKSGFSKAYLHHLFRSRELLGYRLATIHNLWFMTNLVKEIRESILEGKFLELKKKWLV